MSCDVAEGAAMKWLDLDDGKIILTYRVMVAWILAKNEKDSHRYSLISTKTLFPTLLERAK